MSSLPSPTDNAFLSAPATINVSLLLTYNLRPSDRLTLLCAEQIAYLTIQRDGHIQEKRYRVTDEGRAVCFVPEDLTVQQREEYLNKMLQRMDLSQMDMARMLGISQTAVGHYDRKLRKMRETPQLATSEIENKRKKSKI